MCLGIPKAPPAPPPVKLPEPVKPIEVQKAPPPPPPPEKTANYIATPSSTKRGAGRASSKYESLRIRPSKNTTGINIPK